MESIHTDVTKTLEEISRIMQEMDAQKNRTIPITKNP